MVFNYFGKKGRYLINLYPQPKYNYIIEPFAGSARYAIKYGLDCGASTPRKVWINDKWKVIYDIWIWIQNATISDIRNLPNVIQEGKTLYDYQTLSETERNLLGFAMSVNQSKPQFKFTKFGKAHNSVAVLKRNLTRICGRLKHWKITNLDYSEMENVEGTWFIDPPYQHYNKYYIVKDVDYKHLAKWCLERKGEIIVCEGEGADWLDFSVLRGSMSRTNSFLVGDISKKRTNKYAELIYYKSQADRFSS